MSGPKPSTRRLSPVTCDGCQAVVFAVAVVPVDASDDPSLAAVRICEDCAVALNELDERAGAAPSCGAYGWWARGDDDAAELLVEAHALSLDYARGVH